MSQQECGLGRECKVENCIMMKKPTYLLAFSLGFPVWLFYIETQSLILIAKALVLFFF